MAKRALIRTLLWSWDWLLFRGRIGAKPYFAEPHTAPNGIVLGGQLSAAQTRFAYFHAWRHVQVGRFVCQVFGHDWQDAHEWRTGRVFPRSSCVRCWTARLQKEEA